MNCARSRVLYSTGVQGHACIWLHDAGVAAAIMWREGRLDRRIKRQFNAVTPSPPPLLPIQPNRPQKWRKPTSHQIKILSLPFNYPYSSRAENKRKPTLPNSHLMRQPTGLITEEAGSSRKSPQKPLLLPGIHKDLTHYPKGYLSYVTHSHTVARANGSYKKKLQPERVG